MFFVAIAIVLATVALILFRGTVTVQPWFVGEFQMQTPVNDSLLELGVRRMNLTEEIKREDTTNTGLEPISANGQLILHETAIQSTGKLTIEVTGQYGAGSDGDPPQFGGNLTGGSIYGNQLVIAQAGDTLSDYGANGSAGNTGVAMLIDTYSNSFEDSGVLTYNIRGTSNGSYGRDTQTEDAD